MQKKKKGSSNKANSFCEPIFSDILETSSPAEISPSGALKELKEIQKRSADNRKTDAGDEEKTEESSSLSVEQGRQEIERALEDEAGKQPLESGRRRLQALPSVHQ